MKSTILTIAMMLVLTSLIRAQEVKLSWAKQSGLSGRDYISNICHNTQGKLMMAGSVTGRFDEDTNYTYLDNNRNAWIACSDSNGTILWQKAFGSRAFDNCSDLAPYGNDVVVGGLYGDTLYFDDKSIISESYSNAFIASVNSEGQSNWIHTIGGKGVISNFKLASAADETIYFAGQFNDSLQIGGDLLAQAGEQGLFVASLNTEQKEIPMALFRCFERINLADIHCNDSLILISGSFSDTLFVNDTSFAPYGARDAFAALFNKSGVMLWFFQAASENDDEVFASAILSNTDIALTGYFNRNALMGNVILSSAGSKDVFIARLKADGTVLWAKNIGDIADDYGLTLAEGNNQDLYLTGSFRKIVHVPAEGEQEIEMTSLSPFGNAFIAKFAKEGLLKACFNLPANDEIYCSRLIADNGVITAVGNFFDTVQMQGNVGQMIELISAGEQDMFEVQFIDICDGFMFEAPADTVICPGQSLILPIEANGVDYQWLPSGQVNEDVEFVQPGTYTLYAINDFGCISYDTLHITAGSQPLIFAGNDTLIEAGDILLLDQAASSTACSYLWSTGGYGYFNDNTLLNSTYTLSFDDISEGTILLTLQAENSCGTATDSLLISLPDQSDGITVYPLPTTGPVTLVCEEGMTIETVLIARQTGEVIESVTAVNNYFFQYDLGNMLPGTYIFMLNTNKGMRTKVINKI